MDKIMATTPTKLYTAEDLLHMPEDGLQYEVIEGQLITMPGAGGQHSNIAATIVYFLMMATRASRLGKVYGAGGTFRLRRDPDTALIPDAAFVRAEHLPAEQEQIGPMPLAPDLAVEVRSPSNTLDELRDKARIYLAHGTALVWLVDPRTRSITAMTAGGQELTYGEGDELDGGDVLPDFSVAVAELFR